MVSITTNTMAEKWENQEASAILYLYSGAWESMFSRYIHSTGKYSQIIIRGCHSEIDVFFIILLQVYSVFVFSDFGRIVYLL